MEIKCKNLFNEIYALNDEYLDFLEDVVNIESPTTYKEGVDKVGNYFAKKAESLGFKVEKVHEDAVGDVVFITLNPDASGKIITLSGHIDTVHPLGLFGTPAARRDEKNMYGPGVTDCKGGIIAGFCAMHALKNIGCTDRKVQLLIQSDEENSSILSNKHTINSICEKAKGSTAFINLEAGDLKTLAIQRKGILRYKFTIWGYAAHSAVCFNGVSAITEASHKIIELEKLKDDNTITCNCGIINGGTVANTVPEACSFVADLRYASSDDEKMAEKIVEEVASKTYLDGTRCELTKISSRPAMPLNDRNIDLYNKINACFSENNLSKFETRIPIGGSDAAYATLAGIPCVDDMGVKGGEIHSVREYMELSSFPETAKRLACVIYSL